MEVRGESVEFDALIDGSAIGQDVGFRLNTSSIPNYGGQGILQFEGVGDVDGDGSDDIAAGSRWALSRDFVSIGNLAVFGGLSRPDAEGEVVPDVLYRPLGNDALLEGFVLSDSGDFDGDGRSAFLVGRDPRAEGFGVGSGGHVLHELNNATVEPSFRFESFGGTESNFIGDLNGDGFDELFLTGDDADGNPVQRIFLGNSEGALNGSITVEGFSGVERYTLGKGVSGSADINEDGLDDFAFIDRNLDAVRVIFGNDALQDGDVLAASAGLRIDLPADPTSIDLLDDFNGDGLADLLISYRGGAAIVFGAQNVESPLELTSLSASQGLFINLNNLNHVARSAGDLNGDGLSDINFSDRLSDGTNQTGVVFGHQNLFGDIGFDDLDGQIGFVITDATSGKSIGDTNGDGFDDLLLRAGRGSSASMTIIHGHATPAFELAPPEAPVAPITGGEITGGAGSETLLGSGDRDTVSGGDGDDLLIGGGGGDLVLGDGGNDTLRGAYGDDTIAGGAGADVLIGGIGRDQVDYSASDAGVTVFLSNSDGFGGHAEGDDLRFIEDLSGSAHDDSLFGGVSGNALWGGDGDDRLDGREGRDELWGGGGEDKLLGGVAADTLFGGDGNDKLIGGTGADSLFGDAGADTLDGGGSLDVLDGGSGDDLLLGRGGEDLLIGGFGADTLRGEAGDDTLSGNAGDDRLNGGDGNDQLRGGAGKDIANGDAGDDFLLGGDGADELRGGDGADTLAGEGDGDFLGGLAGNDLLNGGGGNDTLSGGEGADTLTGGAGADLFAFNLSSQDDTITDFTLAEGDRIDFDNLIDTLADISLTEAGGSLVLSAGDASVVLEGVTAEGFDLEAAVVL